MSSQQELALYLNNLQGHTTQQKIEAILEMEADCNLDEVCLMKVIENIAESEQRSHTHGSSHQSPYHFNQKEYHFN